MSDRLRERASDAAWLEIAPLTVLLVLIGPDIALLVLRHAWPRWMFDATTTANVSYLALRSYRWRLLRTADRLDRSGSE